MSDENFLRHVFAAALQPPTEVQERLGKAVAAIHRINQFLPLVYTTTDETALTMLRECELATLEATAHFIEARRLIEAGKPILPPEVGARS